MIKEIKINNQDTKYSIDTYNLFTGAFLEKIRNSSEAIRRDNKLKAEERKAERIEQAKRKADYQKWIEDKRIAKLKASTIK